MDTSINGYPTSGRHASLMASSRSGCGGENTLREGLLMSGTLTGQKVNYLDSGYSEEDPSEQANVTSCLVKTSSGSIYIPPSNNLILIFCLCTYRIFTFHKNIVSIEIISNLNFYHSFQICQKIILRWTPD